MQADASISPTSSAGSCRRGGRRALLRRLAAGLLLAPALALAQVPLGRNIPEEARLAQIRHVFELTLNIDGRNISMAPGGLIRDRDNLIIVPSSLPPGGAIGRYVLDASGQVWRVWLLSEAEGAGAATGGNWNR